MAVTDSDDEQLDFFSLWPTLADKASCSFSHVSDGGDDWHVLLCAVRPAVTLTVCSYRVKDQGSVQSRINILVHVRNGRDVERRARKLGLHCSIEVLFELRPLRLCDWLLSGREDPYFADCSLEYASSSRQFERRLILGLKQLRCHSPRQVGFSALTPAHSHLCSYAIG
jgi:hypothetical protein